MTDREALLLAASLIARSPVRVGASSEVEHRLREMAEREHVCSRCHLREEIERLRGTMHHGED